MDKVLQELYDRFPWTVGLIGVDLTTAIDNHWDDMDDIDKRHVFGRMAEELADRAAAVIPVASEERGESGMDRTTAQAEEERIEQEG